MILYLSSAFNSAHLYHQPQWSDEKNRAVFGRCFTTYGHGHNYVLEVGFKVHSRDLAQQKKTYTAILNKLTSVLDHEHLNFVIPEFKTQIPTTENISLYFLNRLKAHVPEAVIASVKLQETGSIWTEIQL